MAKQNQQGWLKYPGLMWWLQTENLYKDEMIVRERYIQFNDSLPYLDKFNHNFMNWTVV